MNVPGPTIERWERELSIIAKAIKSGGRIGLVVDRDKVVYWRKRIPELVPGVQKHKDMQFTPSTFALIYSLYETKPGNN